MGAEGEGGEEVERTDEQDRSLSEVMRKVAEHFVTRFPEGPVPRKAWRFPTLDCGGNFPTDPATLRLEVDALLGRSAS